MSTAKKRGLVLTAGGARGAYQAGVLHGMAHCLGEGPLPFEVVSGTSAGAINAGFLSAYSTDFRHAAEALAKLWSGINFSDVFRTSLGPLAKNSVRWAGGLTFGGGGAPPAPNHLLDTTPLRSLLSENIPIEDLAIYEQRGGVVAFNTTSYRSGAAVTFFSESARDLRWARSNRLSRPVRLTVDHIMASAAIPFFFPPVKIEDSFYGDGAIRMKAQLSPAIHLGADKIVTIGVRCPRTDEEVEALTDGSMDSMALSEVAGVVLNSVFLDSLDADIERLERINRTLALIPDEPSNELRPISLLTFQPSVDLGTLPEAASRHFPRALRYLLGGIGADESTGNDLLSYLAFHSEYEKRLLTIGYDDAMRRKDEIVSFFA